MADKAKQGLLERTEDGAREASPLWQWVTTTVLIFLPIELGYLYAAQVEQASGMLDYDAIMTILYCQGGGAMAMLFLGMLDMSKGYSRRLLRMPDPKQQPPGPYRIGSGLVGLIPGLQWIGPALGGVGLSLIIGMMESRGPMVYPDEVFWRGREGFRWLLAAFLGFQGAVTLVGLIVRQRLRERGRPI